MDYKQTPDRNVETQYVFICTYRTRGLAVTKRACDCCV